MSSRYGRKQKRAAREQIGMLELSLDTAMSGLTNHRIALRTVQDRFDDLKQRIVEWDGDIRSMLGPYTSFAINDATFRLDQPDHIREMAIMPELPSILAMRADEVTDSVSYYVARMFHLIVDLDETDRMTLRRYLSLRLKWGTDRQAYSCLAMSESSWAHLKQAGGAGRARAIRNIAEQLLDVLSKGPPKPRPANGDDLVDGMARDMKTRKPSSKNWMD